MPLITSPIDGKPMQQINRYGIEIDVCPTSGGIWLDKGELEKLMHFIKEETANEQLGHNASHRSDDRHPRKGERKQESSLSKIMDLFDF